MGFFDKVKGTAESAMEALTDAAKDVTDKGKEMTEKARINKAIKNEETKINNLYMIIGQKFFKENSTSPAGYEDQFNGIAKAKAEIEKLQKDLENKTPVTSCPKCGVKVNPGQQFCQGCGAKLTADTPPAQPTPVQPTPVQPAPVQPAPAQPEQPQTSTVQPEENNQQ